MLKKLLTIIFLLAAIRTYAQPYHLNPVINLQNQNNITIRADSIFGGGSICINLRNCTNVHIVRCRLTNSTTFGIQLYGCTNVEIDSCLITKVKGGVYAQNCFAINVHHNQFQNMLGPYPNNDFVQFNNVNGTGNRINYNDMEDLPGQSSREDGINLYKCNGDPSDPIQVMHNRIRGGGGNSSVTGSGITVADQGGSWQDVEYNIIVNPGYVGMQVAGGTHITMINNQIYSKPFPNSHLGLGRGNYSGVPTSTVTMGNNQINFKAGLPSDQTGGSHFVQKDTSHAYRSPYFLPEPTNWRTNTVIANIDSTIIPVNLITGFLPTDTTHHLGNYVDFGRLTLNNKHDTTIRGNWFHTNTNNPAVTLTNCQRVKFVNCLFGSTNGVNGIGLSVSLSNTITTDSCYFERVSTGVLYSYTVSSKVTNSQFKNIKGPKPQGSAIRYDHTSGPNQLINNNAIDNTDGASSPEILIDIVTSNGLPNSPIKVTNNQIRCNIPTSTSGGGILLGDGQGNYQYASGNKLVSTGSFGIGIAGGQHNSVINNKVFSGPHAGAIISNVGIKISNGSPQSGTCQLNTVTGNLVNWWSDIYHIYNNVYNPGSCYTVNGITANALNANISSVILPSLIITNTVVIP